MICIDVPVRIQLAIDLKLPSNEKLASIKNTIKKATMYLNGKKQIGSIFLPVITINAPAAKLYEKALKNIKIPEPEINVTLPKIEFNKIKIPELKLNFKDSEIKMPNSNIKLSITTLKENEEKIRKKLENSSHEVKQKLNERMNALSKIDLAIRFNPNILNINHTAKVLAAQEAISNFMISPQLEPIGIVILKLQFNLKYNIPNEPKLSALKTIMSAKTFGKLSRICHG